ncbi:MAG: GreA/GreB family elongation factor [Lautropia sp.]
MIADPSVERTLTDLDHARLERLLRDADDAAAEPLEQLLATAAVVPSRDVAADVVTMNSEVLIEADGTAAPMKLAIRYPSDADPTKGAVSVLAPAGASILGSRVGASVCWSGADGRLQRRRIKALLYQPERSGDYLR